MAVTILFKASQVMNEYSIASHLGGFDHKAKWKCVIQKANAAMVPKGL